MYNVSIYSCVLLNYLRNIVVYYKPIPYKVEVFEYDCEPTQIQRNAVVDTKHVSSNDVSECRCRCRCRCQQQTTTTDNNNRQQQQHAMSMSMSMSTPIRQRRGNFLLLLITTISAFLLLAFFLVGDGDPSSLASKVEILPKRSGGVVVHDESISTITQYNNSNNNTVEISNSIAISELSDTAVIVTFSASSWDPVSHPSTEKIGTVLRSIFNKLIGLCGS
jgi:hypothetical protein